MLEAIHIIEDAFKGKTDRAGKPYVEHLYRVQANVREMFLVVPPAKNEKFMEVEKIYFHDPSFEGGTSKKFFQWLFGKKEKDIYSSFFHTKKIRFESEKHNLAIKVSGEIVAKTPATFANRQRILKIIVARDTMKQEKE